MQSSLVTFVAVAPKLSVMSRPEIDLAYAASLARLKLSDDEARLFQEQLGQVLEYADKLGEVDVTGVEATAHALPVFDVVRVDEVHAGLSAEEALRNAPREGNGLFLLTKVIE